MEVNGRIYLSDVLFFRGLNLYFLGTHLSADYTFIDKSDYFFFNYNKSLKINYVIIVKIFFHFLQLLLLFIFLHVRTSVQSSSHVLHLPRSCSVPKYYLLVLSSHNTFSYLSCSRAKKSGSNLIFIMVYSVLYFFISSTPLTPSFHFVFAKKLSFYLITLCGTVSVG